jgi:hypothetical protein
MQEHYLWQRSITSAKGVRILRKTKFLLTILMTLLLATGVGARDYIEVWPEGWSEVSPLFTTSIFADRFFVDHDQAGTSFLSMDGLYFKELDLTYRLVRDAQVNEEVVLRAKGELANPFLGLDQKGNRYVLWLERSPEGNTLNYSTFGVPYTGHKNHVFWETNNIVQDLAAFQVGEISHVVWSEREGYFQIRYAQIDQGQLVAMETITNSTDLSVRPSVIVDKQGVVHVAWMETTDLGVQIQYSKRVADRWTQPLKIGSGSVQDIQQGGSIALTLTSQGVALAWAALPKSGNRLFVYLAQVSPQGEITTPTALALGSRARFVNGAPQLQLVWQGVGRFGSEVNHGNYEEGRLTDVTNLTVGRKAAFRPEVIYRDGHLYIYWLQAQAERGYEVYGINNQFPKTISLWRKVGIDETAPLIHVFFLFVSTIMLASVYTIMNLGVLVVGGLAYGLIHRSEKYKNQPLFYQIALIAAILTVARYLPIPSGSPQFFGLIHYGVSFVLAIMGTYLIMRNVRQRGTFVNITILFLWMLLFQFFALIPQNILQ